MKDYRKLMEQELGRELNSLEVVHHKDGNHFNNKLSNLEILSRQEHNLFHLLKSDEKHKFIKSDKRRRKMKKLLQDLEHYRILKQFNQI